jgi:tetratricopeptide (TPR) repeat protein
MMNRRTLTAILLAPITVFGLYRCSYLPIHCSIAAATSERQLVAALDHDDDYGNIVAGRRALDRLRNCDIHPLEIDPPLLIALSYRVQHQYNRAIASYERCLTIDRRPEIYLGLGMTQIKVGRRQEALQNLVLACAFDPTKLDAIDDGPMREDVKRAINAQYGPDWLK